jgi:hypothetical protein
VVLDGDLAFFVFNDEGLPLCHILSNSNSDATKRAIVVEAGQWHAMTAAPKKLGGATADTSIRLLTFSGLNTDLSDSDCDVSLHCMLH